jgi:hypothetical protein
MTDLAPQGVPYRGLDPANVERERLEFLASLVAYDLAARASPRAEPVLPPDVDLDAELSGRFAEICQ